MIYQEVPGAKLGTKVRLSHEGHVNFSAERWSEKNLGDYSLSTKAETKNDAMMFGKVLQDDDEESKEMSSSSSEGGCDVL